MIRFSSTAVPFAFRSFDLRPGEALTDVQLATLLKWHPAKQEIALVCSDRPTLLAATAAFRAAMVVAPRPAKDPAPRPVAQQLADTVAALTAEVAALKQQLAETQQALAVATAPKPRRARKAKAQPVTPEAEAPAPTEAPVEDPEAQLGDLDTPF